MDEDRSYSVRPGSIRTDREQVEVTMRLYKFRDLEHEYGFVERIFTHNELYCSPPARLNDPFELATTYSFEATDEEKINFWIDREEQRRALNAIAGDQAKRNYIAELEREVQKSRLEFFFRDSAVGILSLSRDWRNLVMWSHYARNHTGICIEFETDNDALLSRAEEMNYSDDVTRIEFYQTDFLTAIRQALSRKFGDWEYEKEWRVWRNPAGVNVIDPRAVTAVYFGMNSDITSGNRRVLHHLLSSNFPRIDLYKVERDRTTFQLRANRLIHPVLPTP